MIGAKVNWLEGEVFSEVFTLHGILVGIIVPSGLFFENPGYIHGSFSQDGPFNLVSMANGSAFDFFEPDPPETDLCIILIPQANIINLPTFLKFKKFGSPPTEDAVIQPIIV